MVAPEKNFQNRSSHMTGKCFLRLGFANIAFHKSAMLQPLYTECTESVLDIPSHPASTIDPLWLESEKTFLRKALIL